MAIALTGCPPTGEPPPFDPIFPDAEVDAQPDAEPDVGPDPGCEDRDDDGWVEAEGCALPAGDCAPDDGTRNPGVAEICNLRDDNCNGRTDEDNPGGGVACETGELGLCAQGTTTCDGGEIRCVPDFRPAAAEACNGDDDDCDGEVDEAVPSLGRRCETGDPGLCSPGTEQCVAGEITCVADVSPSAELCNGLDDDCDGTPDNGNPGGGGACDTGLDGLCGTGVEACVSGDLACQQTVEPVPELCNGLDDNCDGATDEAFPTLGDVCFAGEGICRNEGAMVCTEAGDGVVCNAVAGDPQAVEVCNGFDDDCDGTVDEGYPLGVACTNGEGACERAGQTVCNPAGDDVVCDAVPGEAFDELCNGIDDDCDQQTDESFPVGMDCVDDSGLCDAPGTFVCSADGAGVECDAPPVMPVDEICNDLDDDCDDAIDEAFPDKGADCADGQGECRREGSLVCGEAGALVCSATAAAPTPELCDDLDNDCDGRIDNQAECPGPLAGTVLTARIAEFDEGLCQDLDADGTADNALGAVAGLFNAELRASLADGRRKIVVRAPGDWPGAFSLEVLEGVDHDGVVVPHPEALTPAGKAHQRFAGLRLDDGRILGSTGAPFTAVSPLFYSDAAEAAYRAASALSLGDAKVHGALAEGPDGGLASEQVVLTGWFDRDAVLAAYRAADEACAAAGDDAPTGCAERVTPQDLEANLQADLERDEAQAGLDAVSACLVLELTPALDAATSPPARPTVCAADDDCIAGLRCRALPWAEPGAGAALEQRCGRAGVGGLGYGEACQTHEDCTHGLCAAGVAGGKQCTRLCADDAACGEGMACRGVPVEVPGATDQGGASARVCLPVTGSGEACAHGCPGDEVCTPWLGGGVGVAGGAVTVAPRCQAPAVGAAALGEACADDWDCARGMGCVPGLDGAARCAETCAAPRQCGPGALCTDRPLLAAQGDQPALEQGFCLPVPPALGSGAFCDAAAECAPGEGCAASWLGTAGAFETWCAAAEGFFVVGQPCAAHDDCADGACVDGVCSGLCEDDDDCGPTQACLADAWRDDAGRVIGAACQPASVQACARDRDCNSFAPCAGDRCVCDGGECRKGCRFPGVCADGDYCQPDGVCTPFCRDDMGEPNDDQQSATPIPLGRALAHYEQAHVFCATSAVDWFSFSTGGQPIRVQAVTTDDAVDLSLELVDHAGEIIAVGARDAAPGTWALALSDPAEAAARQGQLLYLRVRAAGTFDQAAWRLIVDVDFPACPDPDAAEPRDGSWEATEILAEPGQQAEAHLDSWICPQDVDWYGFWLNSGDSVTLTTTLLGNDGVDPAHEALEIDLIGPDHPSLPSARVLANLAPGAPVTYTAPNMFCDGNTNYCAFADGTPSRIFCGGSDTLCQGSPYYVRVRGAGSFDLNHYRVDAEVDRVDDLVCVPDLFEVDDNFLLPERVHARMGPASEASVGGRGSLPLGQTFSFPGLRACGVEDGNGFAASVDRFTFWMERGEKLVATITQPGPAERLQLDFYNASESPAERLSALPSTDPIISAQAIAGDAAFYTVGVLRSGREAVGGPEVPYNFSLPYGLSVVRLPVDFTADTACDDPVRINMVGNVGEYVGDTDGANNDHEPLDCLGGAGPDRVYVVRIPAGAGVLRATVTDNNDPSYDPAVAIRTNCDAPGSELACNEDDATAFDPFHQAKTQAVVQGGGAGRDVFVIVDSHDATTSGRFHLSLRYLPGDQCDLDTGECEDPCDDVNCAAGQLCDPDDGQCVDCLIDGQCAGGERCIDRACVGGGERQISDWGADNQDEPNCNNAAECTPDEQCTAIPLSDSYCLLPCNDGLACPDGFLCCRVQFGVLAPFCAPVNHELANLCQ